MKTENPFKDKGNELKKANYEVGNKCLYYY